MQIERVKVWQWMVVGVLLGTVIGYMWGINEPSSEYHMSQVEFEGSLGRKGPDGQMLLSSIKVHPPITDVAGKPIVRITGGWLRGVAAKDAPDKIIGYQYKSFEFLAKEKYTPSYRSPIRTTAALTPAGYLDEVKKVLPDVSYQPGWEGNSNLLMGIGAAAGFVLIGVVWPGVIRLLIAAGLANAPVKDEDEYDLSRYGNKPEPAKMPVSLKPITSEADKEQLASLTAEMERKLEGFGEDPATVLISAETTPGRIDQHGPSGVKTLSTTPVEEPKATEEAGHPKDYKGEFYPVVRGKT